MMRFFRHIWHDFWSDLPSRWLGVTAWGCNAAHWILFAATVPRGDQFVPLHYTIYFGIDLTGHWTRAFAMPGIGTALILLHIFLSNVVPDVTWRRAWFTIAAVVNVILLLDGLAVMRVMQGNI